MVNRNRDCWLKVKGQPRLNDKNSEREEFWIMIYDLWFASGWRALFFNTNFHELPVNFRECFFASRRSRESHERASCCALLAARPSVLLFARRERRRRGGCLLHSHGLFPSILNLHYYSSDKQLDSDDGINLRNRCSALQRSSVSSCSLAILDNTL